MSTQQNETNGGTPLAEPTGSDVSLAPLSWWSFGGWKRCRKCGKQTWETNLGECHACRGDKWLSTEDGERMRDPNTEGQTRGGSRVV